MNATHEEWRPAVGVYGYDVSTMGRVRSFRRSPTGRLLRGNRITNGYLQVQLVGDGRRSVCKLIHCLVLEAFVGPRPEGFQACHNDGDQLNNRLDNLRWDTPAENVLDVFRHGRHHQVNKTECPHGHRYDAINTYWRRTGGRGCKTCLRARTREWRLRNA